MAMEPISGIDLSHELAIAENEVLEGQRRKVRSALSGIVSDIAGLQRERISLVGQLAKVDANIAKATTKYESVKRGDWSVLNENMLKNSPTPETSA